LKFKSICFSSFFKEEPLWVQSENRTTLVFQMERTVYTRIKDLKGQPEDEETA
jgi:hypothetical protein